MGIPRMRIFLSYRRNANVQRAMNLALILRENLRDDNVFLDTDDIETGMDFPEILHGELEQSQLVLRTRRLRRSMTWRRVMGEEGLPQIPTCPALLV